MNLNNKDCHAVASNVKEQSNGSLEPPGCWASGLFFLLLHLGIIGDELSQCIDGTATVTHKHFTINQWLSKVATTKNANMFMDKIKGKKTEKQ